MIGQKFGPYEVVAILGAGGMGEVYRARDTRLNRDVALKVLPELLASDADRVARFSREAQTLAALNHPYIAQIYGAEDADRGDGSAGCRAIVMELVEGETLAERIRRGPIPCDDALPIARQIAEALEAAHEAGIIHRDLKPANIKLRGDGTVKVLDFGLAKAVDHSGVSALSTPSHLAMSPTITSPAMSALGTIIGTASYMAPEQAKGRRVDKRADMWGYGCVLYEMLTGRRAFDGEDVSDVLATVLKGEPDWSLIPRELPEQVRWLLRGCLEKDPQKRVADAAVARFVLGSPAISSPPVPVIGKSRPLWAAIVLSTLVGVALIGVAGWWTFSQPATPPRPVRLAVVPPSAAPFSMQGSDRDVVISADDRWVVYRTVVDGVAKLAARELSQSEPTILQGTDNARSPFFAPNGLSVGFFADNLLKKVSLLGGPPVTLCATVGSPRGASWAGDTIYFATANNSSGLLAVPAEGGEAQVLTRVNSDANEVDHLFPSVLPDGSILFTIFSPAGDLGSGSFQVALYDPRTKNYRALIAGSQPHYLAPGVLLFAAAGVLRAVAFDPANGQLTGEPIPVLEAVSMVPSGAAHYTISDRGTLVYVPGAFFASGGAKRSLVWVRRDGSEEPLPGDPRGFVDPRLSPNEGHVTVEVPDGPDDVWTLDVKRGALTRQSFAPGEDETAVWLPDGKSIVYASSRAGTPRALHRRRVDGVGDEEVLWTGLDHLHVDAVTPDGSALVITKAPSNGGPSDVVLLPLDGSRALKPLLTSPFSERNARLSRDGSWIVYTSNETGREEVFVRAFPSLERRTQVSTSGGAHPVWSHNGDELFFISAEAMMAVPVTARTEELVIGTARKLFADRYVMKGPGHTGYDVSRDGRFLMVKPDTTAPPPAAPTSSSLMVVLNWLEEVRSRLQ